MLGHQSLGMENYDPMGEYQTMDFCWEVWSYQDRKSVRGLLFGLVIAKILVKALQ